jgi:hypothetical protein
MTYGSVNVPGVDLTVHGTVANPALAISFEYNVGLIVNACLTAFTSGTQFSSTCVNVYPSNGPFIQYIPFSWLKGSNPVLPSQVREIVVELEAEGLGGDAYGISRLSFAPAPAN